MRQLKSDFRIQGLHSIEGFWWWRLDLALVAGALSTACAGSVQQQGMLLNTPNPKPY